MSAGLYNIEIEQGSKFEETIELFEEDNATPLDLTGCTAVLQCRKTKASNFVIFELNTDNGGIVVAPEGQITLLMHSSQTEELNFQSGYYDLEVTYSDGEPRRELEGKVTLSREVTR